MNIEDLEFSINEKKIFNFHFINAKIGFLWKRNMLFKTIDGGLTWFQIINPAKGTYIEDQIKMIKSTPDNEIFVSVGGNSGSGRIYSSIDFGQSWNIVNEIDCLLSQSVCLSTGLFEIKNNFLYAQISIGGPATEKLAKLDLKTRIISMINLEKDIGYLTDICYYDSNNGVLVGSGFNFSQYGRKIVKINDLENSHKILDSFNAKTNVKGLTIIRNNGSSLTASIFDGYSTSFDTYAFYIHISKDNGNSWKQIVKEENNSGKVLYAVDSIITYVKYAYGQNCSDCFVLMETNDFGETWNQSIINFPINKQPEDILELTALDNNTLIFRDNVDFFYSVDKGQNWIKNGLPVIQNGTFYFYRFKSLNEIYAWGSKNNWPTEYDYFMYKSTDIGKTWSKVVNIPDNNGIDLGSFGVSTFFGSDFAIVSTGGNSFYKIDLANNNYTKFPFNHPDKHAFINEDRLFFLDDDSWIIVSECGGYPCFKITHDQGQNWESRFCQICGNNFLYNEENQEIIAFSRENLKIERLANFIPKIPTVFGNTNTTIDSIENYFIPVDIFSKTHWELSSGGELILDPYTSFYKAQVKWNQNGQHILKVQRKNLCGESEIFNLTIQVNNRIPGNSLIVFPNPFNDELNIEIGKEIDVSNIVLYNSLGQLIKANYTNKYEKIVTLNNFNNFPTGIYFLKISDANKNTISIYKLVKK
ncbi:MAG: T9SS type A sorting domain-containing protein [Deltaproteobacteria bacterium]